MESVSTQKVYTLLAPHEHRVGDSGLLWSVTWLGSKPDSERLELERCDGIGPEHERVWPSAETDLGANPVPLSGRSRILVPRPGQSGDLVTGEFVERVQLSLVQLDLGRSSLFRAPARKPSRLIGRESRVAPLDSFDGLTVAPLGLATRIIGHDLTPIYSHGYLLIWIMPKPGKS